MTMEYFWFISAGFYIFAYHLGIAKGEDNVTRDVLNILEKETKK